MWYKAFSEVFPNRQELGAYFPMASTLVKLNPKESGMWFPHKWNWNQTESGMILAETSSSQLIVLENWNAPLILSLMVTWTSCRTQSNRDAGDLGCSNTHVTLLLPHCNGQCHFKMHFLEIYFVMEVKWNLVLLLSTFYYDPILHVMWQ